MKQKLQNWSVFVEDRAENIEKEMALKVLRLSSLRKKNACKQLMAFHCFSAFTTW